jgi:hypothetical protein
MAQIGETAPNLRAECRARSGRATRKSSPRVRDWRFRDSPLRRFECLSGAQMPNGARTVSCGLSGRSMTMGSIRAMLRAANRSARNRWR